MSSQPVPPIYLGLAEFAGAEDLSVSKDGVNPHFNYNYMTEPALFTAARAALARAGLSATISFFDGHHETVTTHRERDGKETPAVLATIWAKLTIRDVSGFSIECSAVGQGLDPADKAYAKAMTMASKYVVQKALMIAVDADDTDNEASGGTIRRTVSSGGGGGLASEKQLNFLAVLLNERGLAPAEVTAMRLSAMEGEPVDMFEAISRKMASNLIEKVQAMNLSQAPAVLAKLVNWETANGVVREREPDPYTGASSMQTPQEGSGAVATAVQAPTIQGELHDGETAAEAMERMTMEEMRRRYPEEFAEVSVQASFDPATEPLPAPVAPPPTVVMPDNEATISPGQIRLLWVLVKEAELTDERRHQITQEVTGQPHIERVPQSKMDALMTVLKLQGEIARQEGPGG